jgi:outer membrane lipoprotein SlyB
MRKLIFSSLAATLALSAPAVAFAQTYGSTNSNYAPNYGSVSQDCQQSLNNNRLAGGAIGAVAGAVLGKQLAGRNARKEGTVLGAVVGAVAGSQIAKGRVACDDQKYSTYEPNQRQDGYRSQGTQSFDYSRNDRQSDDRPSHRNHRRDIHHAYQAFHIPPAASRQECGWGEAALRRPDGLYERQQVWMCRDNRGDWQVAN